MRYIKSIVVQARAAYFLGDFLVGNLAKKLRPRKRALRSKPIAIPARMESSLKSIMLPPKYLQLLLQEVHL